MTELRVRRRDGQDLNPVTDGNPLPVAVIPDLGPHYDGFQTITVSTTVIGLQPSIVAHSAIITVEVAAIRFVLTHKDTPTASNGHILEVGDILTLDSDHQIHGFHAVRRDAANATLSVSYGS